MKNLRARRFSNKPIKGDLRASMSVAGTLWTCCNVYIIMKFSLKSNRDTVHTNNQYSKGLTFDNGSEITFPLLKT